MSEFKGTKGKWSYIAGDINKLTVIKIGNAHEIELEINVKNRINEEIANALLISKAPEMLDMLKDIKDYLGSDKRQEVEQLIKQATEL
jgi:hypothetical protein